MDQQKLFQAPEVDAPATDRGRAREKPSNGPVSKKEAAAVARTLFDEMQAARKQVDPDKKATGEKPTATNLSMIRARLAEGYTVDDVRAVIARRADEVRRGGDFDWFNTVTVFRPRNFARAFGQRDAPKRGKGVAPVSDWSKKENGDM